ncbi:MAG: cell division protein FtsZ [Betaproteobacteria bacterium]|nr:cell division protein FtsZ [Betaproteobacteria bacterium]NBT74749.1 cell division protein FtsZ [Betaproteobacteria bacterium]NBY14580.1 cell division protein FtsZ [Betaproteobacteria bacterium]
MSFEMLEVEPIGTIIKVVGVGGAGGNAVQHMINRKVQGVEFIVANTDAQALERSEAHRVIQLGESGLGAGAKPEAGRAAAESDRARIVEALRGAHMVFITAGMGGGTGTGAAPVVAEVAKELGALTVAVVTKPFSFEGDRRLRSAEAGLAELEDKVDSLIVILNEKLEEVLGDDISQVDAFSAADDVLNKAVAGIAEIINVKGSINVDFQDVKTVMSEQGKAMMGTGAASGENRARLAAEQAVRSPLLEGVDLSGARGILVNISASQALKLKETKVAMEAIRSFAADDATIIFGTVYDESMGDEMRVTVVATGLGQTRRRPTLVTPVVSNPITLKATGTHDAVGDLPDAMSPSSTEPVTGPRNYTPLDQPAIWRAGAKSEAAARVIALEEGGMDRLDIPAFLRKQAD